NPGATYSWSTGDTTQSIVVMEDEISNGETTVSVLVENDMGLLNTDTMLIQLSTGPHVELGDDTLVCDGAFLELSAENPGMAYMWNTGAITQDLTVNQSG